jgi:hypothetical protein
MPLITMCVVRCVTHLHLTRRDMEDQLPTEAQNYHALVAHLRLNSELHKLRHNKDILGDIFKCSQTQSSLLTSTR